MPAARDLTAWTYLSFRAAQGTRHPETVAQLDNLSFTVTLRDGAGSISSIDVSAYGGGVQEPYQRTRAGSGVGWQNEYETIRIRLTDFTRNGNPIMLDDVVAVRFELGAAYGSIRGRVALDDIVLSADADP